MDAYVAQPCQSPSQMREDGAALGRGRGRVCCTWQREVDDVIPRETRADK